MRYFGPIRKNTLLALLAAGWATGAYAGGFSVYEIGTPDLGLASAGYTARAQDAATAVTNPAGMTRLSQSEILLGIQPLYGELSFKPNSATTVTGNTGGNTVGWFPSGGGYFVYSATEDFKIGLSTYGNFGSALDYDEDWVGRFYLKKATLLGLTLSPSIAYRMSESFSVGIAFNAMYTMLAQTVAINNNPLGFFDTPNGELNVKDNTWGYGATLGLLYELSECTRFGFTYISKMKLDFEDNLNLKGVFPAIIPGGTFTAPINLEMTVPQSAMTSFFHQLTKEWSLLGNVGWQNWKKFGKIDLQVATPNPVSASVALPYKDTWHAAIGAQYQAGDSWRYSLGAAYDSSMISDEVRTPALPIGSAWRLGMGAQYFMSQDFDIGLAYTLIWGGDLSMDQRRGLLAGRVAGKYEDASVHYFGLSMHWKF